MFSSSWSVERDPASLAHSQAVDHQIQQEIANRGQLGVQALKNQGDMATEALKGLRTPGISKADELQYKEEYEAYRQLMTPTQTMDGKTVPAWQAMNMDKPSVPRFGMGMTVPGATSSQPAVTTTGAQPGQQQNTQPAQSWASRGMGMPASQASPVQAPPVQTPYGIDPSLLKYNDPSISTPKFTRGQLDFEQNQQFMNPEERLKAYNALQRPNIWDPYDKNAGGANRFLVHNPDGTVTDKLPGLTGQRSDLRSDAGGFFTPDEKFFDPLPGITKTIPKPSGPATATSSPNAETFMGISGLSPLQANLQNELRSQAPAAAAPALPQNPIVNTVPYGYPQDKPLPILGVGTNDRSVQSKMDQASGIAFDVGQRSGRFRNWMLGVGQNMVDQAADSDIARGLGSVGNAVGNVYEFMKDNTLSKQLSRQGQGVSVGGMGGAATTGGMSLGQAGQVASKASLLQSLQSKIGDPAYDQQKLMDIARQNGLLLNAGHRG